jgi:hypothetical protein
MRAPWHILQNGYCMFRPVLKFIFRIAAWLSGMLAFALLTISLYHRFQIFQESSLIERPIGQLVEVDGKRLNVYTTGMGDRTLVFLSGLGTNAPTLDFKALYSRLENDYRVVVVERLGYGYSDDGDDDRSLDKQLSQTRKALKTAEISGPYVLVPHSMAGLEAVHWANRHPEEVEALIGLDMSIPPTRIPDQRLYQISWLAKNLGLARLPILYDIRSTPTLRSGTLNRQDESVFRALFHRRSITQAVMNEVKEMNKNLDTIRHEPVPQVPTLIFAAIQKGGSTGSNDKKEKAFVAQNPQAKLITMEGPHYIHDYKPEEIARYIRKFLSTIKQKQSRQSQAPQASRNPSSTVLT